MLTFGAPDQPLFEPTAMTSGSDTLETLVDNKPVHVFLPLLASKEMLRAHCIYRETTPPGFNLLFNDGILPVASLDLKGTAILSFDGGRPNLPLEARIRAVQTERVLEMVRINGLDQSRMREYFRVDASIAVIARPLPPEVAGTEESPWSLAGRTLDISGNGILAVFPEKPSLDEPIRLEITLPAGHPGTMSVLARPVRSRETGDGNYEVAYHFEDIPDQDRDRIIGCCLVLQRKLLRLPIQLNASTL
jgi:hypothetical protein